MSYKIVSEDGHIAYVKGEWSAIFHNEDGPAVILNTGTKIWYINGKRHREDGPAVEYSHGFKEYWFNGNQYSEEKYLEILKF